MAIKNLIVITDDSQGCAARIDAALTMAAKYDAHLTGVYAQHQELLSPGLTRLLPSGSQETVNTIISETLERAAQGAKDLFFSKVSTAGHLEKAHWHAVSGYPDQVASLIARYADIVLVGQYESSAANSAAIDPGEVVFRCGRPLLVLPQDFNNKPLTEHAVVAWNRSREAARALADAMLILETKTRVTVLTVDAKSNPQGDLPFNVVEHLKRHGINATKVELPLQSRDPGIEIMQYAQQQGADLLIMGAYSHSRWREQVLGGATRSVLENLSIPVFMSH